MSTLVVKSIVSFTYVTLYYRDNYFSPVRSSIVQLNYNLVWQP